LAAARASSRAKLSRYLSTSCATVITVSLPPAYAMTGAAARASASTQA
jgi:hypothetical protein